MADYLTTAQVAERLGMSANGVRQLFKSARLASVKPHHDRLVDSKILESFMSEQSCQVNTHKPGGPGNARLGRRGKRIARLDNLAFYPVDFASSTVTLAPCVSRELCQRRYPACKAILGAVLKRKTFRNFKRLEKSKTPSP